MPPNVLRFSGAPSRAREQSAQNLFLKCARSRGAKRVRCKRLLGCRIVAVELCNQENTARVCHQPALVVGIALLGAPASYPHCRNSPPPLCRVYRLRPRIVAKPAILITVCSAWISGRCCHTWAATCVASDWRSRRTSSQSWSLIVINWRICQRVSQPRGDCTCALR
jgi:hypothetical protein